MHSGNPLAALALAKVLVAERAELDAVPDSPEPVEAPPAEVSLVEHHLPALTRPLAAVAGRLRF